ncbi:MAG TPA: serine/threonine-protein kinase [Polyangiaceae bacterium]
MTDPRNPNGLTTQRYERLGVIGSGGQGTVYRAFDHWTQRPVAIKVLGSEAAREPRVAERLSREQQALSTLKGTAAVEVLDVFRGNGGELCLVMELLNGTNLDEHLAKLEDKRERMPLARVADIFDPIVDTLEIAHRAGILHRDLKPANVFLLEDGGVRLLDFGMARLRKSTPLTADGTVMGSPSFMAPEAWWGKSPLVDHRADVYSLGVILFRVVAGELPFSGLSLYEKMLGSTKSPRPSLAAKRPELPRNVDDWVELALAIDRERRFQNVRALWNAFLATFHVEPSNRAGKRPSFFERAADKLRGLAGLPDSAAPREPSSEKEVSFVSAALAGSVMRVPEPTPPESARAPLSSEATVELAEKTLELAPPTVRRESPVERTLELSQTELVPREDTPPEDAAPKKP